MSDELKKYEHFIPVISDKIRVINLELLEENKVPGFWSYKIIYFKNDEIKEEHVMGQDVSDALYRFSKIIEMPFTRFPSFLKTK